MMLCKHGREKVFRQQESGLEVNSLKLSAGSRLFLAIRTLVQPKESKARAPTWSLQPDLHTWGWEKKEWGAV